jgi:hypothetical protein
MGSNMVARSRLRLQTRWAGQWRVWLRWTLATAAGEFFGFAIPALAGAAAFWLALGQITMSALLVTAGVGEGAVLGLAQWLALRQSIPNMHRRSWVLATALAAGIAWALAMFLVTLRELNVLGSAALAILALPCGIIFLCSIGGAQWWVLRRCVTHAGWWVIANAVAWPAGVAIPVVGMALLPDSIGALMMLVIGVICGLLMGAVVGAITGIALVRLLPERAMEGDTNHGNNAYTSDG